MSRLGFFEEMSILRSGLQQDTTLSDYVAGAFDRPLTILIGNRPIDLIEPDQYPCLLIVARPNGNFDSLSDYALSVGVYNDAYEPALQALSDLVNEVMAAMERTPAFSVVVQSVQPDGDMFHPRHHLQIDGRFGDFAVDMTAYGAFITWHADSQLDADTEPELQSEEVLPQ